MTFRHLWLNSSLPDLPVATDAVGEVVKCSLNWVPIEQNETFVFEHEGYQGAMPPFGQWRSQLQSECAATASLPGPSSAIAFEFGIQGGASHPEWHQHQGGTDSKFWLSISNYGKPTLRGQPLLERVRELLKIPYPLS